MIRNIIDAVAYREGTQNSNFYVEDLNDGLSGMRGFNLYYSN